MFPARPHLARDIEVPPPHPSPTSVPGGSQWVPMGPNGCHLDSHQRLMRQEGRAMLLRRSVQRIEALLRFRDLPAEVTGIDFLNELWINGFPHILWLELLALTTVSFTPGWMPLASMSSTHHPSALAAGMRFKPLKPTDRAWQPIWSNLPSTNMKQYDISKFALQSGHTPFVPNETYKTVVPRFPPLMPSHPCPMM